MKFPPPVPFNLVFKIEIAGVHHCIVRGIPPCFYCMHNLVQIQYTPNAEVKNLITYCEVGGNHLWEYGEFLGFALFRINCQDGAHVNEVVKINHPQDCCEFIANPRLWADGHAVKMGEYEII